MGARLIQLGQLSVLLSVAFCILSKPAIAQVQGSSREAPVVLSQSEVEGGGFGDGNWGLSYFNFTTGDTQYINRGGGSWHLYQYLSFNYKIDRDQRFAIRPTVGTDTAGVYDNYGNTRSMNTDLGDFHFAYMNYALASVEDWDLSGTFYLYLPTSKSAQDKKWSTRLRSWLILTRVLDHNWQFTYNAKPEYFFNTQKAYRSERTNIAPDGTEYTTVKAKNNMLAKLDHYIEFGRYLNRYLTPQLQLGFVHEWYHPSQEANSDPSVRESFKISPNTWITVNNQLRFIVGIENTVDIRNPRQEKFALFQEQDNTYCLLTFWTLL